MLAGAIQDALQKLGTSGLYGTAADYRKWLGFIAKIQADEVQTAGALDALLAAGRFVRHDDYPEDYVSSSIDPLPDSYAFACPRLLEDSPIQFFRSRLLTFLRQKGVNATTEVDIVIAAVEAIENAVKYSSGGAILVHFDYLPGVFHLEIINDVMPATPDHDIEIGKYDSSRTLMRGMMVMSRLFDEMDIGIDEKVNRATFRALKRLSQ